MMHKLAAWTKRAVRGALASGILLLMDPMVQEALAQHSTGPVERPKKPIVEWLLALAFTILVIAIAFWNPKRSHLN